jgi:hypothetical protein
VTLRAIGMPAFALGLLVAATACSRPAQAIPVEYDLTITFIPGNPVFPDIPGNPVFPDLTGGASFSVPGEGGINLVVGGFDIGTLIPGNPVFTGRFIPGNPVSPIDFSFGGLSGGFPAFAFFNNVDLPNALNGPPILPLPIFDVVGPPIRVSGQIVAFDAPVVIGTWDVTVGPVGVPGPVAGAGLPGLLAGFGAILAWYRKRRAVAA